MYKITIFFIISFIITIFLLSLQNGLFFTNVGELTKQHWEVQSIDTMKYSRDTAREKMNDPAFDVVINAQIAEIATTGANYVAIGTPYDDEFTPMLRRWVKAAREHKLQVWFRGNFSGWEGWFDYPKISHEEHIEKTQEFILNNKDLFVDGDIFTSCPECENGAKIEYGNPRSISAHREFLITEYRAVKKQFLEIGKKVKANYYSMNGDIARALMDKETTAALDGIVVIDHYVGSPDQLVDDVKYLAKYSGGLIVLGEFGAPIPNIHGEMLEEDQARWIDEALQKLSAIPEVAGINYWVNTGGSTQIWTPEGEPRAAVKVLKKYYSERKL